MPRPVEWTFWLWRHCFNYHSPELTLTWKRGGWMYWLCWFFDFNILGPNRSCRTTYESIVKLDSALVSFSSINLPSVNHDVKKIHNPNRAVTNHTIIPFHSIPFTHSLTQSVSRSVSQSVSHSLAHSHGPNHVIVTIIAIAFQNGHSRLQGQARRRGPSGPISLW